MIKDPVIIIVGPTAIGKTALSLKLSEIFNCEIVSLDSMQVYRHMDIGTAKATAEERRQVAHHLIDIVDPNESYDAKRYAHDAMKAIKKIHDTKKIPLVTGGTGLYLRSLIDGLFDDIGEYPEIRLKLKSELEKHGTSKLHEELVLVDCESAKKIHVNDSHRILRALEIYHGSGKSWSNHIAEQELQQRREGVFLKKIILGLTTDRARLYKRINARTGMMIGQGLKEEVERLLNMGYSRDLKSMNSIGYKHMLAHLFDSWTLKETEELLARDTRRYAKRQYTWFRKMDVEWFEVEKSDEIAGRIKAFLSTVE